MPTSPPRLCPRCGAIVKGRCPSCTGWKANPSRPRDLKTSDRAWRRLRIIVFREQHGMCATPDCPNLCTELDHIVPGAGSFRANLQGLCHDCHEKKTLAEARQGRGR